MAKKAKEEEVVKPPGEEEAPPEELEEDKSTLAYKLAHPEEAPPPYRDEPQEEVWETEEDKAAREAAEAEAAAKVKTEEEAAAAAAVAPPGEEEVPKTIEEAQARIKAAQVRMHEATTAAAEEKKLREKIEADLAAYRTAHPEAPPPGEEKPPERPPKLSSEERRTKIAEIRGNFLEKMWALDNTSPTYKQDFANLMAETDEALFSLGFGETKREGEIEALIDQAVDKKVKAAREAENATRLEADRKIAQEKAWDTAVELGKKAGLQLADESHPDFIMFEAAANRLPENLRNQGPTQEVVDWMVNFVNAGLGRKITQTEAERKRAEEYQRNQQVLGRGIPGPDTGKPKPFRRRTMLEMFDQREVGGA